MCQSIAYSLTVVQAININCPAAKAFDFMSDAPQWLSWACPDVESVQPLPFGQWLLRTRDGLAKLRPLPDPIRGTLDYEVVQPATGCCRVPVRVVSTPTGCYLAVTFVKPERLPLDTFNTQMQHTAEGLNTLKLMLEQD